jgi:hypothetical protein
MVTCLSGLNCGVVILMIWVAGITELELEFETHSFWLGWRAMGQAADFFSLQELSIQLDILDSCIWDCDSSGCYTIKSAYQNLLVNNFGGSVNQHQHNWARNCGSVPSKVQTLIWHLFANELPTCKATGAKRHQFTSRNLLCVMFSSRRGDRSPLSIMHFLS